MNTQWNERYTVIFLVNELPPKKIVLLQRAPWKKFAPNLYTGIGGTLEPEEAHRLGAARELQEEAGINSMNLVEFARCIILESKKLLHYYWLVYPHEHLPPCTEGTLEWVEAEHILDTETIPTTWFVMEEWNRRKFEVRNPFTVFLHEIPDKNTLIRRLDRVQDGLLNSLS